MVYDITSEPPPCSSPPLPCPAAPNAMTRLTMPTGAPVRIMICSTIILKRCLSCHYFRICWSVLQKNVLQSALLLSLLRQNVLLSANTVKKKNAYAYAVNNAMYVFQHQMVCPCAYYVHWSMCCLSFNLVSFQNFLSQNLLLNVDASHPPPKNNPYLQKQK